MDAKYELKSREYKLVLLGSSCVGKTSMLKWFRDGKIPKKYTPTVGIDIRKIVFLATNKKITFNIWDFAGNERYKSQEEGSWDNTDAFIIMFDITNRESYLEALKYKKLVPKDKQTFILANKTDIPQIHWDVQDPEIDYIRTSYKNNTNASEEPIMILFSKYLSEL